MTGAAWFLFGTLTALAIVRLASVRRTQTVFAGPSVLWAIPGAIIVGAGLVVLGESIGWKMCRQVHAVEAVAYEVLGDAAETHLKVDVQRDSIEARPRGLPLKLPPERRR